MDSKPCTCGGENENCFKCFGTGVVPDEGATFPGSEGGSYGMSGHCSRCGWGQDVGGSHRCRPMFSIANPTLPERPPLAPPPNCAICGAEVKEKNMAKHLRQRHGGTSAVGYLAAQPAGSRPQLTADSAPLGALPRCRLCGVAVPKRMSRHLRRVHAQLPHLQPCSGPYTIEVIDEHHVHRGSGVICSVCGIWAETPLVLAVHKQKVHCIRSLYPDEPPSNSPRLGAVSPIGSADDGASREGRDATHGWGGSFRDHGQFGSHAEYDGMDDESTP